MPAHDATHWMQRIGLGLPAATTFLLVIFAALPIHLPFYAAIAPALCLIAIYFWTIQRAELLPYSVVFFAGLLQDILLDTPLGVFTLAFLLTRAIVFDGRAAVQGRPFWVLWLGFGMVSVSALMIAWTLVVLLSGSNGALSTMALTVVSPFVVFPLFVWPLARLNELIVQVE